jgi:Domain of Unknown Function with PDB structure (DUF3857)/Transglutaminase-like superfamily
MTIRIFSVIFLFNLFLPFAFCIKQYPVSEIPTELLKDAFVVVRSEIQSFEVESASKATHRYKLAITILKEGHSWTDFIVPYNQWSKVTNIRARFFDAEGKQIRKMEKDEIKDYAAHDGISLYNDSRMKRVETDYGVFPYTFELEYEVKHTGLRSYPDWDTQARYFTSVQHSEYTLTTPLSIPVHFKVFNTTIKPVESQSGKEKTWKWTASNLPAIKSEPLCPPATLVLPWVAFSPSTFELDGRTGSMSDWKNFGKFLYNLNKSRDAVSPKLEDEIKKITASATTNKEKIAILYQYLQKNTRYVSVQLGIGGWQTYDANYVETNKYGDCKALSNFMKAMLKVVGIEANLAIVRAGDNREQSPTEDFCTSAFNHMILFVPTENIWLECTSQDAPTGYLGDFTEGRRVLLITEEGGKLVRTPSSSIQSNTQTSKTEIVLSENGSASLKNEMLIKGSLQDSWRHRVKQYSKEEFQKGFQSYMKLPSFIIKNLQVQANEIKPEFSMSYEVTMNKFASKASTRLFVPINIHNPFDDTPVPTDKRLLPIEISGDGYSENDEITINIPEGYEVESIPTISFNMTSDFGSYIGSIEKIGNNKLLFKRQIEIRPVHILAERYNELRDFYKKMQQADDMKIVLKKH